MANEITNTEIAKYQIGTMEHALNGYSDGCACEPCEMLRKHLSRPGPSKHTPGPWAAAKGVGWLVSRKNAEERREAALAVGMNPARSLVGTPDSSWFNDAECEANARLMAAAPDLFEALEEALPSLQWANIHGSRCDEEIAAAQLAIAKARGVA